MLFERLKSPGLAQHSYMVECGNGLAVVVDPRRDVDEYLALARQQGLTISHVLVTHRQEDFEIGSASLATATGATIVAGTHELSRHADLRLSDGASLEVGTMRFVVLATPGHTPESVSYAAYPESAQHQCWGVFTGDALFVGATGRVDLGGTGRTRDSAGILFDAIHQKIAPLGDQALIFAAHGSGSACGASIADRDDSTIGIERRTNPVFTMSRSAFIDVKCAERLPRPPYFSHMEQVNLAGGRPPPRASGIRTLQPSEFGRRIDASLVIDTRKPDAFASSHLPGSFNVWLEGLPNFAGWIADERSSILLVVDSPGDLGNAAVSLARVGIDGVDGALAGGIAAWRERGMPVSTSGSVSAADAAEWIQPGGVTVVDVRDEREWRSGHIGGALHAYVGGIGERLPDVPKDAPLIVHCSVGNRAGLAASILARAGFTKVYNMLGGIKAWSNLGLPLVC